jgi:hippurate hydrolase
MPSLKEQIDAILPEIVKLRHELHTHPEIRFEETWTSKRIIQFLEENSISYTSGHAKGTGIIATIEGQGPKTIGLRSDMDALEIHEKTDLPYASTIPSRMHACGHDGHMANLCGTAKILKTNQDDLKGTVKLIFQPAEEQAAGGRYIVEEGLIDDCDVVFGLHGWPTLSTGTIGVKSGEAMASADFFSIEVTGKGCHGAYPSAGIDPIVIASHITVALQSIVSREVNPWDEAVISIGKISAGEASNVIPEKAILEGTFRTLNEKTRDKIFYAIPRVVEHTAKAYRGEARVNFGSNPYPYLYNDPIQSEFAKNTVRNTFGKDSLNEPSFPSMASEDFAFYLQKKPGAFLFLGVKPVEQSEYPTLHSPYYDFNDDALPVGIELFTNLVHNYLD